MIDAPENTPEPEVPNDDDLMPQGLRQPYLWFGLLAIPVILSVIASLMMAGGPEAQPEAAPLAIEDPAAKGDGYGRGRAYEGAGVHSGRGRAGRASAPLNTQGNCGLGALGGTIMTQELYKELAQGGAEIMLYDEQGQVAAHDAQNPRRIHIYLDAGSRVTRVECP